MASSMHDASTHVRLPHTETSHPDDPIPQEPSSVPQYAVKVNDGDGIEDSPSSLTDDSTSSTDSEGPLTPSTARQVDDAFDEMKSVGTSGIFPTALPPHRRRRASTRLIASNPEDVRRLVTTDSGTQFVGKVCCGGGCCFLANNAATEQVTGEPVQAPNNAAFKSLNLNLGNLTLETKLTNVVDLPPPIVSFEKVDDPSKSTETQRTGPPSFVTPHPPYEVFSAPVHNARELTGPGAEKRTYHFDLDVTDYPVESGDVDFVVGGAIGICAPNADQVVDDIFDLLGVPRFLRDRGVLCRTTDGRWPTIWGDEQARELHTTRRDLLTWCSDVQSYPPTKPLLRLLGEYTADEHEKKILMWLASAQGQAAFCDLRTGPYITLIQLLNAFPSCKPPLDHLLSVLNQLMPRFYSLSHDPSYTPGDGAAGGRRLIEIAVTVHELPNWLQGKRAGAGSGFLERVAQSFITAQKQGTTTNLHVPMFRGLMANPLAKEFVSDGPMLLVGAGVGVAPFRGFVQRRLKSANCANKVWVLQGVRDSLLDELYRGEWGVDEEQVKKVVQSRKGKGRYVQDEVRHQSDLVWFIVNAIDGRVFVCGSTKGMGEGVEAALVDVAMEKGNLNHDEAVAFWKQKKEEGQYVSETW